MLVSSWDIGKSGESLWGVRERTRACPTPQWGAKQPRHTGAVIALSLGHLLEDMISLRLGWDMGYGWPSRAGLWGVGNCPCCSVTSCEWGLPHEKQCVGAHLIASLWGALLQKEILDACYHFHVLWLIKMS